jgi:glycosyltransferase involved in cell wall biosynthesis
MSEIFRFTCALDPYYGGVPQGISLISKETFHYGLSTTVISCGNSKKVRSRNRKLIGDLRDNNVGVFYSKALFTNPYGLGGIFKVSLRLIRIKKPDLVVIHQIWSVSTLLGYVYSRLFSIKFVVMPHGSLSRYHMIKNKNLKKIVYILFVRKVLIDASSIIVTSGFELDELEDHLKYKARVIPYAVSQEEVDLISRVANQILFAGRVTKKKNLDKIIQALPIIKEWNKDARLVIAGDGPVSDVNEIKKLIAELGLEAEVKFLGWLGRYDLKVAMSQSQVFVLPSEYENFAHSVMESLSCGTPPVVSERVALAEMVSKYSAGVVIGEISPTEIANGVIFSLVNFEQLSENATRAAREEFSWDKVALSWRNLLED